MDFAAITSFFTENVQSVWILLGAVLVISIVLAAILERRIKRKYIDRGFKYEEDDWNSPNYEG